MEPVEGERGREHSKREKRNEFSVFEFEFFLFDPFSDLFVSSSFSVTEEENKTKKKNSYLPRRPGQYASSRS
jgi:hypothetical protein